MAEEKDVVAVSKIKFRVGGETKEVTVQEARALYEALAGLFAPKIEIREVRVDKEFIYWPHPRYEYAYRGLDQQAAPMWTCNTTDKTASFLSLEVR